MLLLQKLLTEAKICLSCGANSMLPISLVFARELLLSRKNLNSFCRLQWKVFCCHCENWDWTEASNDSLEWAEHKGWPKRMACIESIRLKLTQFAYWVKFRYKKSMYWQSFLFRYKKYVLAKYSRLKSQNMKIFCIVPVLTCYILYQMLDICKLWLNQCFYKPEAVSTKCWESTGFLSQIVIFFNKRSLLTHHAL